MGRDDKGVEEKKQPSTPPIIDHRIIEIRERGGSQGVQGIFLMGGVDGCCFSSTPLSSRPIYRMSPMTKAAAGGGMGGHNNGGQ